MFETIEHIHTHRQVNKDDRKQNIYTLIKNLTHFLKTNTHTKWCLKIFLPNLINFCRDKKKAYKKKKYVETTNKQNMKTINKETISAFTNFLLNESINNNDEFFFFSLFIITLQLFILIKSFIWFVLLKYIISECIWWIDFR